MAAQFSVSVFFVQKLLQRQRTSGSLAPRSLCGGPAPCLDASSRADLVACLRQQPDATLDALRVWLAAPGGPAGSPATDGPCRVGRGLAAKKKSVHAAERDPERVRDLRAAFLEALQTEDVTCFKFVDETSTNLTYCRRYARAEGGQRAHQATPWHGGPNVTLVAALTPERAASGHDREWGRQRGRVCRLPGPGARPDAGAG